jgi:hypothetical protein
MTLNARLLVRRERSHETSAANCSFTVETTEFVNETVSVMILALQKDDGT